MVYIILFQWFIQILFKYFLALPDFPPMESDSEEEN